MFYSFTALAVFVNVHFHNKTFEQVFLGQTRNTAGCSALREVFYFLGVLGRLKNIIIFSY